MKKACILTFVLFGFMVLHDYAYALCVSVPEANLRSGPGTNHEKTWEVYKYMPFQRLSAKSNWYKVKDVDSDIHWIYKKLVTDTFKCAVVKADKANVRNGPGTGYSKNSLSPALKYDSFKVIRIKGSWVHVVDEFEDKGWIFKKLVWIQ